MIKKSQIQTIILTKDREFKHRSVSYLNNIAFNAEKLVIESVGEAIGLINSDPRYLNVLIDGRDFGFLLNDIEQIKLICKKPALMAVLYLEDKPPKDKTEQIGLPNFFIFQLPFEKSHFNEVFHNRGSNSGSDQGASNKGGSTFGGLVASVINKNEASNPLKPAPKQAPKNLTAFETTAHVREAIAMINIVDKNREAIDQIKKIGQIFNGVVGAFGYFSNKKGFNEIRDLSIIIDDVSRYYENGNESSISSPHYELLFNAIKTSFLILQSLRENKEPASEQLSNAAKIHEDYLKMDELKKREIFSQDAIDEMIATKK